MPRVFIDTNVIKFSATKQLRFIRVNKPTRNWCGKITGFQVATIGYVNPNDKLADESEIKKEAKLLNDVAVLAENGKIELFEDTEMIVERMGLPNIGSASGRFYGAPIKRSNPPIIYSRTIIGSSYIGLPDELALNFFKSVTRARFKG